MATVKSIRIEDIDGFIECQIEIWRSLEGILPQSIIDDNLKSLDDSKTVTAIEKGLGDEHVIRLILETQGKVQGIAIGRVDKGVSWLGFIGVLPSQRGNGYGRVLLQDFISKSKACGAHKISLYTSPALQQAITLYVESGFIPEGYLRRHSYRMDMIVYSKHLEQT